MKLDSISRCPGFCDTNEPGNDDHWCWKEILKAIYRLRDTQAHSFLAAINLAGLPNESPSELLLRSHLHAKQLLPKLLVEYREAKIDEAADTNKNKFLRRLCRSRRRRTGAARKTGRMRKCDPVVVQAMEIRGAFNASIRSFDLV